MMKTIMETIETGLLEYTKALPTDGMINRIVSITNGKRRHRERYYTTYFSSSFIFHSRKYLWRLCGVCRFSMLNVPSSRPVGTIHWPFDIHHSAIVTLRSDRIKTAFHAQMLLNKMRETNNKKYVSEFLKLKNPTNNSIMLYCEDASNHWNIIIVGAPLTT